MAYVADRTCMVIARSRYGWHMAIENQATIESDAESATGRSTSATDTDVKDDTALNCVAVPMKSASNFSGFSWSSACNIAWRQWYKRWKWTGRQLCCRRSSLGGDECHRRIDGIGRHGTRWRQQLDCNTWWTAADRVLIPGVLRLPSWFQKIGAALASQLCPGPIDTTESRIVQSQTLRTLSAAALSVSSDRPCRRLRRDQGL